MTPTSEFDLKKSLKLIGKKRYLFVVVALAIITAVAVTSYLLPNKYEAKCTVFIEKSVISDLVKGIAVTPSIDDKVKVLAYAMKSRTLLLKVLNDLDLNVAKMDDAQREKLLKTFQERTDIKLKDREGLFIISFYHENPQLARDYVNTLVRRYIEENVSAKREDSYGASRFLTEQIASVKEKLDKAETKLNAFKQANGGLLAESENLLMTEMEDARQKLDEIVIRRGQLEEQRSTLRRSDPRQAKLAALQKNLNELHLVYTDNYPEVVELKKAVASLKEQIATGQVAAGSEEVSVQPQPEVERITMELNSLRGIERNQQRLIASKRALMRNIPQLRAAVDELERDRNSQKTLYEQLVGRLGQSEVSKQMEVQDKAATFRIVDPAVVPVKPVSPNRVNIMLLGMLAGLAGSFGLLLLLDHYDKSIRSLDELKSLGIPILAIVPPIQTSEQLQANRRRDLRFYALSGAYFSIILAVLSFELLRSYSLDILQPAQFRQNLVQLKDMVTNK
jgi:polysaccharide biosynthesis transport protein